MAQSQLGQRSGCRCSLALVVEVSQRQVQLSKVLAEIQQCGLLRCYQERYRLKFLGINFVLRWSIEALIDRQNFHGLEQRVGATAASPVILETVQAEQYVDSIARHDEARDIGSRLRSLNGVRAHAGGYQCCDSSASGFGGQFSLCNDIA